MSIKDFNRLFDNAFRGFNLELQDFYYRKFQVNYFRLGIGTVWRFQKTGTALMVIQNLKVTQSISAGKTILTGTLPNIQRPERISPNGGHFKEKPSDRYSDRWIPVLLHGRSEVTSSKALVFATPSGESIIRVRKVGSAQGKNFTQLDGSQKSEMKRMFDKRFFEIIKQAGS